MLNAVLIRPIKLRFLRELFQVRVIARANDMIIAAQGNDHHDL